MRIVAFLSIVLHVACGGSTSEPRPETSEAEPPGAASAAASGVMSNSRYTMSFELGAGRAASLQKKEP